MNEKINDVNGKEKVEIWALEQTSVNEGVLRKYRKNLGSRNIYQPGDTEM